MRSNVPYCFTDAQILCVCFLSYLDSADPLCVFVYPCNELLLST